MTPSELLTGLSLIGMLFTIFLYFRNPQVKIEKLQALDTVQANAKTALVEQRMQWEKDSVEKRFSDFSGDLKAATALAQNHIHTVDTKVDALISATNTWHIEISAALVKLQTIVDERLPQKKK